MCADPAHVPVLVCVQFLSLLQNNMIADMLVLYAAPRRIITVLKLGVPVCGHPTIVHGMKQQPPEQLPSPERLVQVCQSQLAALSPAAAHALPFPFCPAHRQTLSPDSALHTATHPITSQAHQPSNRASVLSARVCCATVSCRRPDQRDI